MARPDLVKYKLLEEVGHGGMAVVYRGLDTALNREVAVKILHAHLAEQDESKQRFQREAQAVAKLRHENIIEIYDYSGLDSPESYIVTEFIHGRTLKDFLSKHPISHPEIAAMVIVEICNALAHAHSLGVIHRDIKPENIMIRDDGRVKLTDFGIAQVIDVQRLTVTGQLLGSPAYMAPELVEGKRIDFRADIFSVGTLVYQLATSDLPFKGKNPHEVLKRIAEGRFVDPEVANPIVGGQLARIIRKALAHEPADRYPKIDQLQAELTEFLGMVGITEPRTELAAYFANPVKYSQALQQRVVETLTRKGKDALQQRRMPLALECFNRVLCADPSNQEVLGILDQLARRRRVGRAVAVLALALVLGAGAYLISSYWPVSTGSAHVPDAAAAAVLPDAAPAPDTRVAAAAPDKGATALAAVDARPKVQLKHGKVLPFTRRIEIVPTPKAVTIWVNDKRLGDYGPELRHVELPLGAPAKLVFRNDGCCFERVVMVGARQQPKVLHVKLPWKPGRVTVELKPKVPADVLVGNLVVRPGQSAEVPIPSYSDNGRTDVEVKVSAPGYLTETRKVEVRANSPSVVRVTLRSSE
jgi:predicted Ser/Thr protein kinase